MTIKYLLDLLAFYNDTDHPEVSKVLYTNLVAVITHEPAAAADLLISRFVPKPTTIQ